MNGVETAVLFLIILLTATGLADFFSTRRRLRRDREALSQYLDLTPPPAGRTHLTPPFGHLFADGLLDDAEQDALLNLLNEKEKEKGSLLLVEQRMAAMLRAVHKSNAVRKVPSFTSLRALNLQQAYASHIVWLRAVIPMLLVVGIFGTLMGVHRALGLPDEELSEHLMRLVREALMPGIAATFCTVVLMAFRGWYRMDFNAFMKEIDNMTLVVFLPALQIQSHLGHTVARLKSTLEPAAEWPESIRHAHQELVKAHDTLATLHTLFSQRKPLEELGKRIRELQLMFNDLVTYRVENAEMQPQFASLLLELQALQQRQQQELETMRELASSPLSIGALGLTQLQGMKERYAELRRQHLETQRQLQVCSEQLATLSSFAEQQAARLESWQPRLDTLRRELGTLPLLEGQAESVQALLHALGTYIAYFDGSIPALAQLRGTVTLDTVAAGYASAHEVMLKAAEQLCGDTAPHYRRTLSDLRINLRRYLASQTLWTRLRGWLRVRRIWFFNALCENPGAYALLALVLLLLLAMLWYVFAPAFLNS